MPSLVTANESHRSAAQSPRGSAVHVPPRLLLDGVSRRNRPAQHPRPLAAADSAVGFHAAHVAGLLARWSVDSAHLSLADLTSRYLPYHTGLFGSQRGLGVLAQAARSGRQALKIDGLVLLPGQATMPGRTTKQARACFMKSQLPLFCFHLFLSFLL